MELPKQNSNTRIHLQNINGASVHKGGNWELVLEHLQHMEVDISMMVETKWDCTKPYVHKRIHDRARETMGLGNHTIIKGSTPVQSSTSFKPGGVAIVATGKLRGNIIEKGQD